MTHRPGRRRPVAIRSGKGATGSVTLRALALLEAFLPGRNSLTLSEMAAHAGLPLSTAHRLAADLLAWGALERGETGRYQIGSKLRQVAANAPRGTLLREQCLPHLEDLAELTGYSALLAILDGAKLVYLEQAHGDGTRFKPSVQQPPTLATAAGRVLTAFAPPHLQREILGQPVMRLTPYTETSQDRLRSELDLVRRQRFAWAERQVETAHSVVATPIRGSFDTVIAAIALTVPHDSPDRGALIALCAAATRAASRSLGA